MTDEGPVLVVRGADLMDGTPIYDIKPYVAYADSFPAARSGFAARSESRLRAVSVPFADHVLNLRDSPLP